MGNLNVPDHILDNPVFNDLPSGMTPLGGRLMSSAPHTDGMFIFGPEVLAKDSANLVLTRNAKGDWSLNRVAAGAETYNVRISLGELLRTGETYNLGLFGSGQAYAPSAPAKGLQIIDFFVIYSETVATLTTATLRLGKTVFSKTAGGAAFAQTDIVAATGISTAVTPAAGQPIYQSVAGPSPLVFSTDDLGLLEIEAVFVMQNTGVIRVYGMGCHVNFNFN